MEPGTEDNGAGAADAADASAEANRLYWETDTPVAEIAQRLEMSRRALYGAVRPAPAGEPCYHCGSELVWENRSARNTGNAHCPECAPAIAPLTSAAPPAPEPEMEAGARLPLDPAAVRIGAGLAAGAAAGALLTLMLVRRR